MKELLLKEPVAITGIGVVCSAGDSPIRLWESVTNARASGEWLNFANHKFPVSAVHSSEIDVEKTNFRQRKYDRSVNLAIYAARNALIDAGALKETGKVDVSSKRDIGVIAGTSRGMIGRMSELFNLNPFKIPPSYSPNTSVAALSGALAKEYGFNGFSLTVSANCASSAFAIALGAKEVAFGTVDAMLVGGAEAPLHPAILGPMSIAGILGSGETPDAVCRPFDVSRNGTIIGEGAAFLYLERLEQALSRGAKIYGTICGWGTGVESDSGSVAVEQTGESMADIIQMALEQADISPNEVSFISAHGTGTKLNDLAESRAINIVFGEQTPPVFSIKAVTGHCLGASSAIESLVSIIALNKSRVPPTTNCFHKDPACKINVVVDKPQNIESPNYALVISSGFWGYQSAIVFKRFKPATAI